MQPSPRRSGSVVLALAGLVVASPAQAATASVPGLGWGLPFLGLLASIAVLPMVAPLLWRRFVGLVALLWVAALLLPQAALGDAGAALHDAWQALLGDFLPFAALLLATYTVGGGVLIDGGPWGTPAGNTALLALATLAAAVAGPMAASMVLIHPLLRANAHRRHRAHLVVFFIVLVCNVGGMMTPLGKPPLYVGVLQGVPFLWTVVMLWQPLLVLALPLLGLFWWYDWWRAGRDAAPPPPGKLRLRGAGNLVLLWLLLDIVFVQSVWDPGSVVVFGASVPLERLVGAALCGVIVLISDVTTSRDIRRANQFGWRPIAEVAQLFAAIFVTITPVLAMLAAGRAGPLSALLRYASDADGQPWPLGYFWLSGLLSAVLNNAPTYDLFFQMAGGDAARLMENHPAALAALSAGSVCFGALTYIGSAPNLIMRGVAERRGVRMPGFFGYTGWATALMLPGFLLMSVLFFL